VYVVAGVFFALSGLLFQDILIYFSQISINAELRYSAGMPELNMTRFVVTNTFGLFNFLLLFMIPLLTMRSFSEEKKSGTFELLVSYPLNDWSLLLGKYLAALSIIILILVVSLVYPAVMFVVGEPELPVILSSYLGLLLISMAYVAYGIFSSSITENQIVAAIMTFAGLLFFYLIGDLASTQTGMLVNLCDSISVRLHSMGFTSGLIESPDVAYFILFTGFFLFLTARVLESRRWRV
jgi:ABC-2 type transport system permease protein